MKKAKTVQPTSNSGGSTKPFVTRRSSSLSLLVEATPGTTIERACSDAVELANRLQITIDFKFNDVLCMAKPGVDAADLATAYFDAQKSDTRYKFAVA